MNTVRYLLKLWQKKIISIMKSRLKISRIYSDYKINVTDLKNLNSFLIIVYSFETT